MQIICLQIALCICKGFKLEKRRFSSCGKTWKAFICVLKGYRCTFSGLLSLSPVESHDPVEPRTWDHFFWTCTGKYYFTLSLEVTEIRNYSIYTVLRGKFGNEPAKEREPSFRDSLMLTLLSLPSFTHSKHVTRLLSCHDGFAFAHMCGSSNHYCRGLLRLRAQVWGCGTEPSNVPTVRNEIAIVGSGHSTQTAKLTGQAPNASDSNW